MNGFCCEWSRKCLSLECVCVWWCCMSVWLVNESCIPSSLHVLLTLPNCPDSSLPLQPGRRDSFACRRGLRHIFFFPPIFLLSCLVTFVSVLEWQCMTEFFSQCAVAHNGCSSRGHYSANCEKLIFQLAAPPFPSRTAEITKQQKATLNVVV